MEGPNKTSERITAGPIETLELTLEKLDRIGFASFRGSNLNVESALMETTERKEHIKIPNIEHEGSKSFIGSMNTYFAEKGFYLAYANYDGSSSFFKRPMLTGDLYRSKTPE